MIQYLTIKGINRSPMYYLVRYKQKSPLFATPPV
ncbi:hypothetical protein [Salmonella phage SD-1_S14]|nr:hypothetical protein [Salmonella phage SD-2_S15]WPK19822.1 hypothetical protein [Salmonella phage SD-1_S14]WPK20845.1 hypothetical protein [Salmonella phage SD-15_S21]